MINYDGIIKKLTSLKSYFSNYGSTVKKPDENLLVEILSLTPYKLNLTTNRGGLGGKVYSFQFGDRKKITFSDLENIVDLQSSFTKQCFYLILDSDIVKYFDLSEDYDKFLSPLSLLELANSIKECEVTEEGTFFSEKEDSINKKYHVKEITCPACGAGNTKYDGSCSMCGTPLGKTISDHLKASVN